MRTNASSPRCRKRLESVVPYSPRCNGHCGRRCGRRGGHLSDKEVPGEQMGQMQEQEAHGRKG